MGILIVFFFSIPFALLCHAINLIYRHGKSCHTKEGEQRYWQNRRQESAQDTGDTISS